MYTVSLQSSLEVGEHLQLMILGALFTSENFSSVVSLLLLLTFIFFSETMLIVIHLLGYQILSSMYFFS